MVERDYVLHHHIFTLCFSYDITLSGSIEEASIKVWPVSISPRVDEEDCDTLLAMAADEVEVIEELCLEDYYAA